MKQAIVQIDAFTDRPFGGNPAAVCLMKRAADETWMQNIATEMNLSETAFLFPENDGYRLRWFTPVAEVQLCGHATLATAFMLYNDGMISKDSPVLFHTLSGLLKADYDNGWINLDFPSTPPVECKPPDGLLEALEVEAKFVGQSKFDLMVEVESEQIVRSLNPDFGVLAKVEARAIIVTAQAANKYDIISRVFAPKVGINEDPVTGSAHCVLTPYWAKKLDRQSLLGYQASARGGELKLRLEGDRVILSGQAVITLRGELL